MAFPTPSTRPLTEVTLLDSTPSTLDTLEVLGFTGEEYRINLQPLKPADSNTQGVRGDATHMVSNLVLQVVLDISGGRPAALKALHDDLVATAQLQVGTATRDIAGFAGILGWQPLGDGWLRVDVEFIPESIYWNDSGDVLGVL